MTAPPQDRRKHAALPSKHHLHLRVVFASLVVLFPLLNFVILSVEHGGISGTTLGSEASSLGRALDMFVAGGGSGHSKSSLTSSDGGGRPLLRGHLDFASSFKTDPAMRMDAQPPAGRGHSTFPFYLSCPGASSLPPGTYRIVLLYQVDLINNWRELVKDQLHTLAKCGLGRRASSFVVAHGKRDDRGAEARTEAEELKEILAEYSGYVPDGAHPKLVETKDIVSAISTTCGTSASYSKETFVFHFHSLGASVYDPGWRVHIEKQESAYAKMLYYRKYVEHFFLERPAGCIDKLLGGAETCGIDMSNGARIANWRYGGDYWAASCEHIESLPSPTLTNGTIPGTWIGSATNLGGPAKHVELRHINRDPINPKMTYPEEYDANATAFHLACRRDALPPGNYKLAIVFHVGILGNWKGIVEDQLETLSVCGLGQKATEFLVTYSGGDPAELRNILARYGGRIQAEPRLLNSTMSPWEGLAMNETRDLCQAYEREKDNMIVFYLHAKGVSRYNPKWRELYGRRKGYAQVLYWRKFMEWFTIERPSLCVNAILDGAKTCGVKYRFVKGTRHIGLYHYSGNFWSASCGFLSKLPPLTETDYYASEFWLGEGMPPSPRLPINYSNFVDLHLPTVGWRGYPNYDHLMLPEEYVNEALLDDTYTSFV